MTNKYKLLVIDVDGTLLNGRKVISKENREALSEAISRGISVSLSTGRATPACLGILKELSLDGYHIFFDGALACNPTRNEEIYAQPLNNLTVSQMVKFARERGIDLELYSSTRYFAEYETWSTEAHRNFFNIEPTIIKFDRIWERERIIKGGMACTNPAESTKAKEFRKHFADSLYFSIARAPAYPDVDFINIISPHVSKGRALEALVVHLGLSLSEVVAVGDGINDVPLFSIAGLAVAMGNAPDEVKAMADHITLDVDHSGLAEAIKKFLI